MLLKAISLSPATANYHANLGMVTITLKLLVTGIYSQLPYVLACRNILHNLGASVHTI